MCALAQALCRWCGAGCAGAYVKWLATSAERALRQRHPPSAALVHTLATVKILSYTEINIIVYTAIQVFYDIYMKCFPFN